MTSMRDAIRLPSLFWPAILLLLAGTPSTGEVVKSDWSKVQSMSPGTRMKVLLYKDAAPREGRRISGRFASATVDRVTLTMPDGGGRTLERQTVQQVRVRLPIRKRRWGWINWAIIAGGFQALWIWYEGVDGFSAIRAKAYLWDNAISTLPALPLTLLLARTGKIYNVPPANRDP